MSIALQLFKQNPEKPGYLMLDRRRTHREIYLDAKAVVEAEFPDAYWVSMIAELGYGFKPTDAIPEFHDVAVSVSRGSSEGWLVKLAVVSRVAPTGTATYTPIVMVKFFDEEDAWRCSRRLYSAIDE